MKQRTVLTHEFVEFIPDDMTEGVLYVSVQYATVAHKCCCDCGKEVVTPLSPTDWRLIFDGKTITLDPSIGNWSFECQSHYWIKGNRVKWAPKWSREMIDAGRARDRFAIERYYGRADEVTGDGVTEGAPTTETSEESSIWQRLRIWWRSL